ncbi:MAG: Glycosyl transferase group 1 [Parcubacteria group bacterium GW2011_GWF2_39_13b]|nr:MAG: Glycosyl transferase group 1 [Parcubacteria group bacterium GW2011_GWF2_39_13b]
MKITIIFNNRLPTERAHGLQIVKTCEAFAHAGIETKLIIPDVLNKIQEDIFQYYQVGKVFSVRKIKCWGKSYRIKYASFLINLLFSRVKKNEIIFTRHPEIAFLFSQFGYKVIFELHNWRPDKKKRNVFFLKKVFLIIATTKIIKQEFVKNGFDERKIMVAPNGVELEDFNLKTSKEEARNLLDLPLDKEIILYSGHLYKQKGVYTIVETAKMLSEKYFVFIGGLPNDVENLKQAAEGLKNIEIRGPKKYKEVPRYLKAADMLVIANSGNDETERNFTSPLKLFEYLAAEKVIIASRVPAIEEFLDETTAVFFEPDSAQSLAKAIEEVSGNQAKRENLEKKSFELARKYTWQERTKKIINVIKKDGKI